MVLFDAPMITIEFLSLMHQCTKNPTLFSLKVRFFRSFTSQKLVPKRANIEFAGAFRVLNLVTPKKRLIDVENRRSHLQLIEGMLQNDATKTIVVDDSSLRATKSERKVRTTVIMEQGLEIDVRFLSRAVSSCGSRRDLFGGVQYHCLAITTGFIANVYVGSSLISLYGRCALLGDAYRVFDEMPERNVVSWSTIIAAFAQEWRVDMCLELFCQMRGLAALKPNCFTYTSLLSACMGSGALGHGKGAHCQIIHMGFHYYLHIENALIAMYSKCGALDDAMFIFENMQQRDVVTWNSLIAAYAQHGLAQEAISLFEEMMNQGVNPDVVTYLGILSSCRHGGLVKEGQDYLNNMIEQGVQPELDHYSCIVDLLGRAGLLLEARDFIRNMPVCPNAVIWGSLLSSSRLHGDVWIGIEAAESRLLLEPRCTATLQQLANLYASVGWWNQVAQVRKSLKDKGLKPNPGCSWIEIKSRVHRFEAQNKSNNKITDILLIMGSLFEHMSSLGLQSQISGEENVWSS
ncbi:pentatricopeptide repeat-containing protein At2g37320-like [Arachis stenosperma]|uniref:pentatricopeptide repeat-containing protein At2g37320-like n=1 Tax=Arachis stenosperma TaxID=217475 RepID=UPI0025AC8958|nr:pentatricopeptide repeat-containing protein At2g37320-like [Arachis stenosperma]